MTPWRATAAITLLQPLGVLVDHRVNDVDERLVAVEQAVPAAQNVAFKPPFHCMLAEHLHDAAVRGEIAAVGILREIFRQPYFLGDVEERLQPVGLRLVGPEYAEVLPKPRRASRPSQRIGENRA